MPEPTGRSMAWEEVVIRELEERSWDTADARDLLAAAQAAGFHLHLAGESCVPKEQLRQVAWCREESSGARALSFDRADDKQPVYIIDPQHDTPSQGGER